MNSTPNLPFLSVSGHNEKVFALIDSGSSLNIISSRVLHLFRTPSPVVCSMPVKTVAGKALEIKARVDLTFHIQNFKFTDTFHILEDNIANSFNLIIGVPFLSKFGFKIDFQQGRVINEYAKFSFAKNVNKQQVNAISSVKTSAIPVFSKFKEVIPQGTERIVQVRPKQADMISSNYVLITAQSLSPFKNLFIGSSVCENDENSYYIKIANLGDEPIHINKGSKLGIMEDIFSDKQDEHSINYVDTEDIGEVEQADLEWEKTFDLEHLTPRLKKRVQAFLSENSDVFAASVLDLPGCDTLVHEIKLTDETPVKSRPYRVPYNLRGEMEEQLNILLESGIIVPSTSDFSSPVMLVKKADGGYRLAVDFRKLNKQLIKDNYPIPNINESIDALAGTQYFSTLDLTSGFFQQVIAEEDQFKTAITTHKGLFQFTRTPFGLATSPNAFQRLMNLILGDLSNLGILIYIDDIAIASKDVESHFDKLNLVFNRIRQHNLRLKPSKCHFFKTSIVFLGFKIEKGKISPIDKNIKVISQFKTPTSRKQVRSFLGCLNYYRKFFPDFSKRSWHLTNLTKEKEKFYWNENAQAEFEDFKTALASIPTLNLPDMSKEFVLFTDASGQALGAVLAQMDEDGFPSPVAFASKKMKEVETRYSTTERELLALVWAINYFKCYIFNRRFTVFTDHAALTHALKIKDPTSRIARWLCAIGDFDFETKFIKGKCNSIADFLSRFVNYDDSGSSNEAPGINAVLKDQTQNYFSLEGHLGTLLEAIKLAQTSDTFCQDKICSLNNNVAIQPSHINFFLDKNILKCQDLRHRSRRDAQIKIVLPLTLVPKIFSLAHESVYGCHMGFFKTLERIRQFYFWPGMYAQIKNLIKSCQQCLEKRAHKTGGLAELQRIPIPNFPMYSVHVDVSGPYPQTFNGNRYIVAFVCSFSKWPEAFPVQEISSDSIAEVLSEFICRHGCPYILVTDRGSNFVSQAITRVYEELGIRHIATTPYHPAGNAKVERQHATISEALSHLVNNNHTDWDRKLKFALLAIRSAVHASTKEVPAFVVTGRDLRLPYQVLEEPEKISYNDCPTYCQNVIPALKAVFNQVKTHLEATAEAQENYRKKDAVDKGIDIGDQVMLYSPAIKQGLCRKFSKLNKGPFRVVEKISKVNYRIQLIGDPAHSEVVHVDRLSKVTARKIFPAWPTGGTQLSQDNQEGNQESATLLNSTGTENLSMAHPTVPKYRNYPTRFYFQRGSANNNNNVCRQDSSSDIRCRTIRSRKKVMKRPNRRVLRSKAHGYNLRARR